MSDFDRDTSDRKEDALCWRKVLLEWKCDDKLKRKCISSSSSFNFITQICADLLYIFQGVFVFCLFFLQLQVSLLSKFLLIAKCCYEQRNFATAMQILAGLENLIVRQLPVSLGFCSVTI